MHNQIWSYTEIFPETSLPSWHACMHSNPCACICICVACEHCLHLCSLLFQLGCSTYTYRGLSSGSHPSSSLKHTKQRAMSGSRSSGEWKKPASAIWKANASFSLIVFNKLTPRALAWFLDGPRSIVRLFVRICYDHSVYYHSENTKNTARVERTRRGNLQRGFNTRVRTRQWHTTILN